LQALVTPPPEPDNPMARSEPYIMRLPKDPWGRDYQYAVPGRAGPYDLYSFGADGREGGTELDSDIGNWPAEDAVR
jgi:general secretion pathway protein G